jgi:hypothetical protein
MYDLFIYLSIYTHKIKKTHKRTHARTHARTHTHTHTHTHVGTEFSSCRTRALSLQKHPTNIYIYVHIYTYIYIYILLIYMYAMIDIFIISLHLIYIQGRSFLVTEQERCRFRKEFPSCRTRAL